MKTGDKVVFGNMKEGEIVAWFKGDPVVRIEDPNMFYTAVVVDKSNCVLARPAAFEVGDNVVSTVNTSSRPFAGVITAIEDDNVYIVRGYTTPSSDRRRFAYKGHHLRYDY